MPYIGAGIQRFNTADGLTVNGNAEVTGTTALTGNATAAGTLDVTGAITSSAGATITTADNNPQLTLTSTDADANFGPVLKMHRNSGSPADSDFLGEIQFKGENDADEEILYAQMFGRTGDVTDGTEDGRIATKIMIAGTAQNVLDIKSDEIVINDDSVDLDFRVESNGNANMLFVDGGNDFVGIGTNSPGHLLHLKNSNPTIRLEDSDGASNIYGMVQSDGSGSVFLNADDGNNGGSSKISFFVDGSEGARINASRIFLVGKTSASATGTGVICDRNGQSFFGADTTSPIVVNRNNDDGNLVQFLQADSAEGTISVSGTTVSYNGGHLSRWSQATDGNRIDGLVKGTVMTNLDQMAVWHHEAQAATYYTEDDELPEGVSVGDEKTPAVEAYDEDNEQLNCMAVSSVEGDINVAGVFVNWDEDDDYNDMNVAMTGDMVIRIAKDTTVARGNLLMSAGDGTAKPQGDGYVQDKTIAKVTSTIKSHTYDDGSYLVPCVLMAC